MPIRTLKGLKDLEGANEDQTTGIRLLARAIEEGAHQVSLREAAVTT